MFSLATTNGAMRPPTPTRVSSLPTQTHLSLRRSLPPPPPPRTSLSLPLLLTLPFHPPPPPLHRRRRHPPPQIHQACAATRDPSTCEATLAQHPPTLRPAPTPLQLIQHSILSTFHSLQTAQSMTRSILTSSANPNLTDAARNCLEGLFYSEYRLNSTAVALPRGRLKDARAWSSAALGYQYGCWSGLRNLKVNASQLVNDTIVFINSSVIALTSNTLSMMVAYDLFGEKLELWRPPRTERDGFWEDGGVAGADLGFKGGFPAGLTVDVTVCKEEGKGCVKTVQEAVNGAPNDQEGRRFVIKIDEGVYDEIVRVPLEKKNVVFLGDGMGRTVITGALTVGQPGMNTYNTATVGVVGDGFMARDITFQNTAGPQTFQAVAFRSSSDLSIIENCEFLGHQDTLYVHSLRQFYKSCRIEGNVDFIFGNAAAIIQDSIILIRPRQQNPEQGETNPVTAHGRTDPAQSTGIVIQNSVINGTEEYLKLYHSNPKVHKNYLGRPWKEYCRTVFIHCTLGDLISSDGWQIWDGDFALATVYYGEFENTGPGADVTHRVPWSNQIPKEHVLTYSVESFIQGNEWIATS